jgi:pimeloyl-ACP methyl ester carboxylesterase
MTTQQTAETKYIVANGVKLAYRRLGLNTGIPLVMMMHFRGNMDFWDPALINALAKSRPIILLDNAGIGKSGGEIPTTFQGWADHVINLVEALKIKQIDLLGFSMGGGASQFVVLKAPHSVRKLILAGTRTSKTPNTIHGPTDIFLPLANSVTQSEFEESWTRSFFNHDSYGRAAAKASWDRIFSRTHDRSPHLSPELAKRQIEGYTKFLKPHPDNPYERIKEQVITIPVQTSTNIVILTGSNCPCSLGRGE